jgi:hypothetical protein
MGTMGLPELTIVAVISFFGIVLIVWPAARICRKAGFPSWLGALAVVPIANLLLLWFVAAADWPASAVGRR